MLHPSMLAYDEQNELTCSSCGRPVSAAAVQYGQPFITARQLVSITATTAIRAPRLLGDILLKELPPAPYCAACREKLPAKRQAEQFKFMFSVLLFLSIIAMVILYLQ